MSYPTWVAANLTYTPPADIDGEPEDVRELSVQQLGEALAQLSDLAEQTLTQLKAAGVDRCGSVDEWRESDEAAAGSSFSCNLRKCIQSCKWLSQAD